MRPAYTFAFVLSAVSLVPAVASAHALGADCALRAGRVEVEAYYSDDTPARGAAVRVRDRRDAVVAEGRTDDAGRWSFPAPAAGRYAVVVDAGGGHRAQIKFFVPDSSEPAPVPAALADGPERVSEGPSRPEFTRFPWLRLGSGLGIIAILGLAARLALRGGRSRNSSSKVLRRRCEDLTPQPPLPQGEGEPEASQKA